MTTVCNLTGIEFEATSKRQKNHPEVSLLMNDISRYNREIYSDLKNAFGAKKGTFSSIEEVILFAKTFKKGGTMEDLPADTTSCLDY